MPSLPPLPPLSRSPLAIAWLSYGLTAALLLLAFPLHLLPTLVAGLLIYELVYVVAPLFDRYVSSNRSRLIALVLLATLIITAIVLGSLGLAGFLRSDGGSVAGLLAKMAEIIETTRPSLPAWLAQMLPADIESLKASASQLLREHAGEMQSLGKEAGIAAAHMLVGMIIGGMLSLNQARPRHELGALANALIEQARLLGQAFRRIVFAQVKISALNTTFTGIYLAIVLPLFGVHLPLVKTLIVVTFLAGLIPVLGNLISNTVIVVVSLHHSPMAAMGSLAFLVIIHKLEYFLNAKIVGNQINARAWELLLAMLLMEAAFGLPGVVAAPIYYAFIKEQLTRHGLV